MKASEIKEFYESYSDEIVAKRLESPHPLRQYAHRTGYESIQALVPRGAKVLDTGCGQGALAWYLAEAGAEVTAMDISAPNLRAAGAFLASRGVADRVTLVQGDAENLPFPDASFDIVVSSHVLEHLPDFHRGVTELHRVTRAHAIVALPTCLNLAAASQLGGASFWKLSRKAPAAFVRGLARIVGNLGDEGVQEGYAGQDELPHIWRYPWVMQRRLERGGFEIVRFEASTLVVPYFAGLLPVVKFLDRYKSQPILRNLGYGSIAYLRKTTIPV